MAGPSSVEADALLMERLRAVRRRLFAGRLVRAFTKGLPVFLSLAAVILLADRVIGLGWPASVVVIASIGASGVFTVLRAWMLGVPSMALAARAVDDRLDLEERVASAVYVHSNEAVRENPEWRSLVVRDGLQHLEKVDVHRCFRLRVSPALGWTAVPLVAIAAILWWMPALDLFGVEGRRRADAALRRDVRMREEALVMSLERLADEAAEENVLRVRELLKDVVRGAPREAPEAERAIDDTRGDATAAKKSALRFLSNLERALVEKLGSERIRKLDELVEGFEQTEPRDFEATRDLADALQRGELARAGDALEALVSRLESRSTSLSADAPSQLDRNGLRQLAEELARLARKGASDAELSDALSRTAAPLSRETSESGATDSEEARRQALAALRSACHSIKGLEELDRERRITEKALEQVKLAKDDIARMARCPVCGAPVCRDCGAPTCACGSDKDRQPGGT